MFDPTQPANNSPLSSAAMRAQLIALNTDIQTCVTPSQLNTAANNAVNAAINSTLPQTSSNSNAVSTLGQSADGSYQQWQMQMLFDKLDELINTLRR